MLGPYAPTAKPGKSCWVTPYVLRIMAIMLLNQLGIHAGASAPEEPLTDPAPLASAPVADVAAHAKSSTGAKLAGLRLWRGQMMPVTASG